MRKKFIQSRVEPGKYQNIFKQSDFKQLKKQDYLQFFGSTDSKIKEENFIVGNKINELGPGCYDSKGYGKSFTNVKRANTAAFQSNRKDMLFNGTNNPGPMEYSLNTSLTTKNWSTNIGAFGTTEKKFSELNTAEVKPGPG